jgi:tetratricopeptide (TPR) repeat protein
MDLSQRLADLESIHDWYTLVEELEKAIGAEADPSAKALLHVRLGSVLDGKFLQTVKALKHFQDAYKLAPTMLEALEHARTIYWALGKVNMVQKLLELEIKNSTDAAAQVALLCELGDVLVDAGDLERAAQTYSRALELSEGAHEPARDGLFDVQLDAESWEARVAQLVGEATSEKSGLKFLRAARVVKRFAAEEHESMLVRAYQCAPTDLLIASALEGLFAEPSRADELRDLQGRIADRLEGAERARALHAFGARWATRHQSFVHAAEAFRQALELDPSDDTAVIFLRELWGAKDGAWQKVASALEAAADKLPTSPFLPAQIGIVWWRHLGDLIKARAWFERLQALAPSHPTLALFEQQIGQKLDQARAPSVAPAAPSVPPAEVEVDVDDAAAEPAVEPVAEAAAVSAPAAAEVAAPEAAPPPAPPAAAEPAAAEPAGASPEKIAELKAKAEKQEQAKRFNEYVKTLVELAEAVPDEFDKVEYYLRAADLYTNKFSNAAEAVKCYEAVLHLDGENPQAIEFLRQSYEKRRDWEKLIGLMRREASALPEGGARAAKFLEIARLATERVKKPEVCIELWNEVVGSEPDNAEALGALAGLHERAKDWSALADTLRRQADVTGDLKQKEIILGKLGQLFGERLNDDEAAVEAWQQLLAINPQDRKAQEAVKKKYLSLGRWDDLEVFYAESGKWDEFIRVLEAQEAKETDDKAKISLLMKTAELWMAQKGKPDRAAKAYEKVLSIEPAHLAAAESLIPIYQQANNAKGLASVVEVKLLARRRAGREAAALARRRRALRDQAEGAREGVRAFPLGVRDGAHGRSGHRGRRAPGARHLGLGRARGGLSARHREGRGRRRRPPRHRSAAAARARARRRARAHRRRAGRVPRGVRSRERQRSGARGARAALQADQEVRRAAWHLREEA